MTLIFLHSSALSLRGDSVNAQNLAILLQKMYQIESVVVAPNSMFNSQRRIDEMKQHGIEVRIYNKLEDLHKLSIRFKTTHTYLMIDGRIQNVWVPNTKHLIHSVFNNYEPHGAAYAYVSEWLFKKATRDRNTRREDEINAILDETNSPLRLSFETPVSWVPHTVMPIESEPGHFKEKFQIPTEARLVIRIGGYHEFNDSAAKRAVKLMLETSKDVYFVFVNTKPFLSHPRLIYIEELSEIDKWQMYRDCDLAINGRNMGESFGFSIVEPLSVGKPVLAPDSIRHPRMDANHISLLRPVGLTFYSARDLVKKMRFLLNGNYNSDKYIEIANQYSPAISMSRFYNFFLAEELP